uniref:(northern house mosquito) hypothetical protein n=1 Tax=Culex pipiens TaxID=7175 RepID=A0A8D8AY18_CULPI
MLLPDRVPGRIHHPEYGDGRGGPVQPDQHHRECDPDLGHVPPEARQQRGPGHGDRRGAVLPLLPPQAGLQERPAGTDHGQRLHLQVSHQRGEGVGVLSAR